MNHSIDPHSASDYRLDIRGYGEDDARGKQFSSSMSGPSRQYGEYVVLPSFLATGGAPYNIEYQYITRDGQALGETAMMKKSVHSLLFTGLIIFLLTGTGMAGSLDVYHKSPEVQPFFESAYGYAFFPTVGKGGFGIGAAYGEGSVYRMGQKTGTVTLMKASIGFQFGGQAFSELIFFQDKRAYDEFTRGQFEFDATASAVAITAGAQATAGTKGSTASYSAGPATGRQARSEATYQKGMRVFIHVKGGLMYEATIGGQKFIFTPNQ